jgi:iron complex outermembrane recepter protein
VTCFRACGRTRVLTLVLSGVLLLLTGAASYAQAGSSTISGTIADAHGAAIANALVTITDRATGAIHTAQADSNGHYEVDGLPAGTYTVDAEANGFSKASKSSIVLAAGASQQVGVTLAIGTVVQQVTVNAGIDSIAAQAAPSGGFIEERTPQSLVSNTYIENFTSPIADFGELVQVVPGAFTTSSNGVGLGQSKTYFRGFQDGDYNIDFDGIPFYDTNTPTHHSWAFFPSQWVGGIDFDRSPGTASTIGPTPFGGSIHLLSEPLMSEMNIRATASYGTWNTKLYEGSFDSGPFGLFGSPARSNMFIDVHHMSSDGYQTFNQNIRNAGSILYQYQFSPHTVLTGFSGVIQLTSNGPNISSSRCMLYGVSATNAYSCTSADTTSGLLPYTGAGVKFLLTDNSDPTSWFDYQYNHYQVPTDFEYVGLKSELGKGWTIDIKPYTYNYDNGELYSNATPITEYTNAQVVANPSLVPNSYITGGKAYYDGVAIAPCNVQVVKKGIAALPCGIDKYNSYRKYGETAVVTKAASWGNIRTGMWYEWARTDRHQYPSDPANGWADQPLGKFNEQFWTNSYQPYAEIEFHVTPKLNVTPGVKLAQYTIDVLHHADDGSTVGELTCTSTTAACPATIENSGSFTAWLPALDANYRLLPNLSVYAQGATGSIVPPSSVYDYNQTAASANAAIPQLSTPPKQQKSTTYQIGTVYKGQHFTFDADAYHIRFQNTYSSTTDTITTDPDYGDAIYYLNPSSITKGIELETTIIPTPGLVLYLNGSAGNAYYSGTLNANTTSSSETNPVNEQAPSGLWVAQAPTDTETEGLTYTRQGFDAGLTNKRVGTERVDNGAYHNQGDIPAFSSLDGYFNYTIRSHSIFDQTKIRLSGTNLLDSHNMQSNTLGGTANPLFLNTGLPGCTSSNSSATNPCDAFRTAGPTPINGQDQPSLMAGRSLSISVTFGISPKGR